MTHRWDFEFFVTWDSCALPLAINWQVWSRGWDVGIRILFFKVWFSRTKEMNV